MPLDQETHSDRVARHPKLIVGVLAVRDANDAANLIHRRPATLRGMTGALDRFIGAVDESICMRIATRNTGSTFKQQIFE